MNLSLFDSISTKKKKIQEKEKENTRKRKRKERENHNLQLEGEILIPTHLPSFFCLWCCIYRHKGLENQETRPHIKNQAIGPEIAVDLRQMLRNAAKSGPVV